MSLGKVRAVQAIEAIGPSDATLKLRPGPVACPWAMLEETVRLASDCWSYYIDELHNFLVIVSSESVVEVEIVVADLGINTLVVHLLLSLLKQVVQGLRQPIFFNLLLAQ